MILFTNLLRTYFPKGRLFKRVLLPDFLPDGSVVRRIPADIILVERGGVFVIRVKNISGMIDNPKTGNWLVRNQNGTTEIPNPFEQNIGGIRTVKEILKRENVYNVPLYNIVVFSGRKVTFRNRSEKLLTSDYLIEALRDMNRNKFLSQNEIFKCSSCNQKISSLFCKTSNGCLNNNYKKYHLYFSRSRLKCCVIP